MEQKIYRNNYVEGQKIGSLTFVKRYELDKKGDSPRAYFLCECGNEFITRILTAKSGRAKSCGCKANDFRAIASTKYAPPERTETGIKKIPVLTQELVDRFWSKINHTGNIDECWEWQAGASAGYGHFNIGETEYIATRISYNLHYKKDPLELCVLHKCDNPKCCNPHHLFLGTKAENMKDMADKGRSNKGVEVNTNKLTEEQVKYIRLAYNTGAMTKSELAREFGVYHSNIISIVNNKTWKHI